MDLTTHWINFQHNKISNIISQFVGSEDVVNIGCGGADFFKKSIKLDIMRANNLDIIGDANNLPFKNNSISIIFEKDMLHHVTNPSKVLDEFRRVGLEKIILIEANKCNFIMRTYFEPDHNHFQFKKLNRLLNGCSEYLCFSSYPFIIPHFLEYICSKIKYEKKFLFCFINRCFKIMDIVIEIADLLLFRRSFIIYVKHIQEK